MGKIEFEIIPKTTGFLIEVKYRDNGNSVLKIEEHVALDNEGLKKLITGLLDFNYGKKENEKDGANKNGEEDGGKKTA